MITTDIELIRCRTCGHKYGAWKSVCPYCPKPLPQDRLFCRQRKFKPAEYGAQKWWLLPVSTTEAATANGAEFIEITEIVATATMGNLAIYRQWVVDPDNIAVAAQWVPKYGETRYRAAHRLFQAIANMGLVAVPSHAHRH